MWKRKLKLSEAINQVKRKRAIIKPNSGFNFQLKMFEKAIILPIEDIRKSNNLIEEINLRLSLLPNYKTHIISRLGVERTGWFYF